jgi:hypothetical protein
LRLGYVHSTHRPRQGLARQQRLLHSRPVPLQPVFELGYRESIDSWCTFCSQPLADTLAACCCVPLPFPSTGSPPISFAQTPPRQPPHPTAPRPNSVWPPRPGLFLRRLLLQQFASSFVCPTLGITCSGLQRRRRLSPLLTSDGASPHLSMPVAQRHTVRSPRVLRTHLHAYARRIYVVVFRTRIGLHGLLPAHPTTPPLSASCSSRQRFAFSFLQIPSRPGHACLRLTLPRVG